MPWPALPFLAPRRPALNLALQGGGAHGAFTWGVLDALLEADRFAIAGLSGTSAGAINAVLLAHGLQQGGAAGARAALDGFWTALGGRIPFEWLTVGEDDALAFNPLARLMLRFSQMFAPHELNPLGHDPLRALLAERVDFAALRAADAPRLAIAATHANSGRLQVFGNAALDLDRLLASTCLPTLHHTVQVDGEPYWDGGYSANPALLPLLADARCAADTLLVLLAPRQHARTPRQRAEIAERAMDIAFQAPFLRELDLLATLQADAGNRWWPGGGVAARIARARWHLVDGAPVLAALRGETRLIAHLPFLERLRDAGRAAALQWLDGPAQRVGARSSVDLRALARGGG
ncbi:patatin-like phospholipase family protein [Pseudorhodoferax sp.]|uniref:patatin-like phospholipase family protein n=1 Tax=Pseudorhodoferax sp. TaxID=1993553 RepID=UPI002DD64A73|nr:patatin-like phospholipase family protein [Pseudorhodoferax sp.]